MDNEAQFRPRTQPPLYPSWQQRDDRTPRDVRESIEARFDRIENADARGELDHEIR